MKSITHLSVSLVFLAACAVPAPVVKLSPSTLQHNDYWILGQQFVYDDVDGIWFDCAFNRIENKKIVFDIKVTNHSDSAILVDPLNFHQKVFINDSIQIGMHNADDPEWILTNLQLDQNLAEANAKNAAAFAITAAVLTAGAAVAIHAAEDDEEKKYDKLEALELTSDISQDIAWQATEDADIRAENNWLNRRSLEELFLRKTTLPIGYFLEGEVHFPYYPKAKWYDIILHIGQARAEFLFKQQSFHHQTTNHYAHQ